MVQENKKSVSSRVLIAYVIIILWVLFGVFGALYQPLDENKLPLEKVKFTSMAIYFVSLTGFVGAYIYGETVKPKKETSAIIFKGKTDKREIIIYTCIVFWTILGVFGIVENVPLDEVGAYFGALTPFVAAYILGETTRHSDIIEKKIETQNEEQDFVP